MRQKNNIKMHQINNLKRDIHKIILFNSFLILEDALKSPASKIALYEASNIDLIKPHTLNEIKEKIGYDGNDKWFTKKLELPGHESPNTAAMINFFFKRTPQKDLRIKNYQIDPDKIKKTEEWIWETMQPAGIGKKDIIKIVEKFNNEMLRSMEKDRNYLKLLPEKERIAELEQLKIEISNRYPAAPADFQDFCIKFLDIAP